MDSPGAGPSRYFEACGALAALTTTLLGSLLPQPRILMAMGRDGLLPRWFCRVHSASGVPVNATLATGFAAALLAFFMDIDQLSGMVRTTAIKNHFQKNTKNKQTPNRTLEQKPSEKSQNPFSKPPQNTMREHHK